MKKTLWCLLLLVVLVSFSSSASAWTGRMKAMANPAGLLADESDYLTMPSLLARGDGDQYYASYQFGYTDIATMQGAYGGSTYNLSGDGADHEFVFGGVRSYDFGRIGLFATAVLDEWDADGTNNPDAYASDLSSDAKSVGLDLYYARALDSFDFGASVGIQYETVDIVQEALSSTVGRFTRNYMWGLSGSPRRSLDLFALPEDSSCWTADAKVAVSKTFDSSDLSFAVGGSVILTGENRFEYLHQTPVGANDYNVNAKDNHLTAYEVNAELRYSYELGDGYSLPFVLSASHDYWRADGAGIGTGIVDAGNVYTFTTKKQSGTVTVGGGLSKNFGSSVLAGGLYYSHITCRNELYNTRSVGAGDNLSSKIPDSEENRLTVKVAYETPINDSLTFNAGVNFWQGWIDSTYANENGSANADGSPWGGVLAAGLQYDAGAWQLESFVNLGYDRFELSESTYSSHLLEENVHAKIGAAILF